MQIRRSFALTLGALLLAAPLLGACGFDYATDKPYTPATGINDRDSTVDVLAAVIVSGQPDSGTFVATLSNNDQTTSASFDTLVGGTGNDVTVKDFDPVEIAPGGFVNLATSDTGGVPVKGTFVAGNVLAMTLTFGNGDSTTLNVPVVTPCREYAGLDISGKSAKSESTDPAYTCAGSGEGQSE